MKTEIDKLKEEKIALTEIRTYSENPMPLPSQVSAGNINHELSRMILSKSLEQISPSLQ
jgi:hypothetical protein